MPATHDILQLKTEAELRFFVENPSFYQPELVAAAQRELRRRPPSPAAAAVATAPPTASPAAEPAPPPAPPPRPAAPAADLAPADDADAYAEPQPARRPWLLLGSVAAVCLVAGLGFWAKMPASPAGAAPPAASPPAPPPRLEAAPAAPIPTYDTESYVEEALAQVPAAEKRNEQLLNQYRAVSLRFWAAQNPSAHLIGQAQAGHANAVFGAQARLGLGLWHDFDRTQVYSYSFGPIMAGHLARMKVIAQYQREALQELANDTQANRPPHLDSGRTLAHQQALAGLLAPLGHQPGPRTGHL